MAGLVAYVRLHLAASSRLSYKTQDQGRHRRDSPLLAMEIGMMTSVLEAKFWGVVLFGSARS